MLPPPIFAPAILCLRGYSPRCEEPWELWLPEQCLANIVRSLRKKLEKNWEGWHVAALAAMQSTSYLPECTSAEPPLLLLPTVRVLCLSSLIAAVSHALLAAVSARVEEEEGLLATGKFSPSTLNCSGLGSLRGT